LTEYEDAMKIWLRILGGAYILVGSLNSFVFLFILGVYGGKGGVEAIRVEEYVPGIGHLGGWVLYLLLGLSIAGILAGVGLLKLWVWCGRLALLLSVGNLFILPFGTIIGLLTILTLLSKQGQAFLLPTAWNRR
jgi:ABC-type multidrug transport system permease subunit